MPMLEAAALATGLAVASLEVTRPFAGDPAPIGRALADPGWLGQIVPGPRDRPDLRRVQTDLAFTLSREGRIVTFRKAALVDIGSAAPDAAGDVEIAWRATSFAPLFPVFAGHLTFRAGTLRLRGVYAPPGAGVGLLADRAILHHFALRTAGWFLERLGAEVERSEAS